MYLRMAQLWPVYDYLLHMHHNISYKTWGHKNEYWPVLLDDPGPPPASCPLRGLLGPAVAASHGLASPEHIGIKASNIYSKIQNIRFQSQVVAPSGWAQQPKHIIVQYTKPNKVKHRPVKKVL